MKLDGAIRIRFPSLAVSWMTVHLAVLSGMLFLIDVEGKGEECRKNTFCNLISLSLFIAFCYDPML